jgi:16S rRNA (adenine1518-N6/adenine1519-N6)-dimethyltransferase
MLPPLRDIIARHGLAAKKSLGQHFLLDENLCAKIARQAGDLTGRHVVEIGPGPGGLTRALLDTPAATVTAVEIDPRACAAIAELQTAYPDRLRLIQADALATDLTTLAPAPRHIVANLPYNVGTPLLVQFLRQAAAWERLTLMFQLEVAERIAAPPNSPAYGRLGVLAQFCCEADIALRIPPAAFTPPPSVTSAIIVLRPRAQLPPPDLFAAMERLTAAAFGQRRKMLRGALKSLGGETLLASAHIAGDRRAETLTVAELARLARALLEGGGKEHKQGQGAALDLLGTRGPRPP